MPCRFMRLSQYSHPYGWNEYSSVVFGSLVLTCGSPSRPCHYMRLSRHFSPLGFVCGDFGCTIRFRLRFIVRSVGSSIWGPASSLPVFSFFCVFLQPLWSLRCRRRLTFPTLVCCFGVWSAVLDVVEPTSPVHSFCSSFLFFSRSLVVTCGSPSVFSPFVFVRCSFGTWNDFVCGSFTLVEATLSIVFRLLMQFSFSSVFRPAVPRQPSLCFFLVHYFRA